MRLELLCGASGAMANLASSTDGRCALLRAGAAGTLSRLCAQVTDDEALVNASGALANLALEPSSMPQLCCEALVQSILHLCDRNSVCNNDGGDSMDCAGSSNKNEGFACG